MPVNGQVERMNRTLKEAIVERDPDASHDELRGHLALFLDAYNSARRLKTLKGLTPCEFICRSWAAEPHRFTANPHHQMPGPNIQPCWRRPAPGEARGGSQIHAEQGSRIWGGSRGPYPTWEKKGWVAVG